MIKLEMVNETFMQTTKMCDVCGEEANTLYESSTCKLCKKDICSKHKVISPNDTGGDYTEYICLDCFEISKMYFEEIKILENKIDRIFAEMEVTCLRERKDK